MITGKPGTDRRSLAKEAVVSFCEQTYPARRLLILNEGPSVLTEGCKLCWEELLAPADRTLGGLRNLALSLCRTEWVIQWDDDDLSHPSRIGRQLQLALQSRADCCLLRSQVRVNLRTRATINWNWNYPECPGIPGTILHRREAAKVPYREERWGEDTFFWADNFQRSTVALENRTMPELYIRRYHGQNTWDERHVMGPAASDRLKRE